METPETFKERRRQEDLERNADSITMNCKTLSITAFNLRRDDRFQRCRDRLEHEKPLESVTLCAEDVDCDHTMQRFLSVMTLIAQKANIPTVAIYGSLMLLKKGCHASILHHINTLIQRHEQLITLTVHFRYTLIRSEMNSFFDAVGQSKSLCQLSSHLRCVEMEQKTSREGAAKWAEVDAHLIKNTICFLAAQVQRYAHFSRSLASLVLEFFDLNDFSHLTLL